MYYRRIHEPKEGEEVQYLAVYALRWPWDSGVDPTDAFVKADDPLLKAAPLMLEACNSACDFIEKMISTWDEFDDEYLGDEDRAMLDGLRAAIAAASPDSYQAEPEEHNGQHL